MLPATLDQYLDRYSGALAQQAAAACRPLHVPGRDPVAEPPLLRPPYEAQAHVITAGIKALKRQPCIQIAAEMGTGKTLLSQAIIQGHAKGGYRALVVCPPHLTVKWEREIRETLKNAHVHHIESYKSLTRVLHVPPCGRGWWIISNTRAKLGTSWRPAVLRGYIGRGRKQFVKDSASGLRWTGEFWCPKCNRRVEKEDAASGEFEPLAWEDLTKSKQYCLGCGEPLWCWTHDTDRWPVAAYIQKRLPGWFQYLVIDESHQAKSSETAIGHAMGALVSSIEKTICLTGTLMGGYAWHVRPLLFRIAPQSLLAEGIGWKDAAAFDERYGRIERKVREIERKGSDNKTSKGTSTRTSKYVKPGVMPTLFGRHLIQNAIFLSLDELADNLPRLDEQVLGVPMDPELADEYARIEKAMTKAIKDMLRKKDKRLLSKMLHVLLGYPDQPWGWGEIGYLDTDEESGVQVWRHVVTPKDLPASVIRPKEKALIDIVRTERHAGRQTWNYCTMTDTRDVNERLRKLLAGEGFRVEVLRSSVETGERENWIARHGPLVDTMISHPQLVETGLDLFGKDGSYNFPTLNFYSTGYNLFTLRQASRRAWRIGQTERCTVNFLHYAGTMQARAMTLMGKKLAASASIEGKFSSEGLAALAGDEGSLEVALAKSLTERLDDLDVGRVWRKVGQLVEPKPVAIAAGPVDHDRRPEPGPQVTSDRPSPEAGDGQPDQQVKQPEAEHPVILPVAQPKKQLDRHVTVKQLSLF